MGVCPCLSPELSQKHDWSLYSHTRASEVVFTYSQVDPPNSGLPHCILSELFSHISHFNSPIPRCYKPLPLSTKSLGHNPRSLLSLECSLPTLNSGNRSHTAVSHTTVSSPWNFPLSPSQSAPLHLCICRPFLGLMPSTYSFCLIW